MRYSLIVATINRVEELDRLLSSLDRQTYRDFEVIVVDQNPDDRLLPVLENHKQLAIRRLVSERGLSRARNVALRVAGGDIVTFPDDDCWYPDNLLSAVDEWFEMHPEFGALFTSVRSADGRAMTPRRAPSAGPCTRNSVLSSVGSVTGFVRREVISAIGFFDERIGVGSASPYQSGEDIDYFIRPLEAGFRMWYEPSLSVYHPELQSLERLRQRTYGYALGIGYVLRKHKYTWWDLWKTWFRSVAGAILHLCKGDLGWAQVYLRRAAGLFHGYRWGMSELKQLPDFPAALDSTAYKSVAGEQASRNG
jgi:glycosyltransferase involved in cell wall biosynthesis